MLTEDEAYVVSTETTTDTGRQHYVLILDEALQQNVACAQKTGSCAMTVRFTVSGAVIPGYAGHSSSVHGTTRVLSTYDEVIPEPLKATETWPPVLANTTVQQEYSVDVGGMVIRDHLQVQAEQEASVRTPSDNFSSRARLSIGAGGRPVLHIDCPPPPNS